MSGSGSSPLHVVTLGEEAMNQTETQNNRPDSPSRPRTALANDKTSPKDAMPRPISAAINRYKATQSARDKKKNNTENRPTIRLEIKSNLNVPKESPDAISLSSPIKKDFQYIPDTFVNTITKTVPAQSHSGPPVGAHTAGFYSKLRMENHRPPSRSSITLTSMLSEITGLSKSKQGNSEEKESTSPTANRVSFFEEPRNTGGTVTIIDTYVAEPDTGLLEDCLAQLTDVDAHTNRILDSLADLLDATETETVPPMAQTLYEAGAITVLVELLPRTTNSADVQGNACQLLKYIMSNYAPASETFLSLGGLPHLLKAAEISSKAYAQAKANSGRTQSIVQNGINRTSIPTTATPEIQLEASNDENVRIVPITQQSLAQGVYGKYFKPDFLNEFHEMSPDKCKKTFSHFINVFQKLERLINANSSMAFDGNAYGSLEKLLNDATSMLQVEEVLLYKVDEETGEMSQLFMGENEVFPAGTGIAGYCVKAKQMLVLKNPKQHPQFVPEIDYSYPNGHPHGMMTLPISASGHIITGVLIAINKRGPGPEFAPLPFDGEDEYMFKCLGFTTGAILSNTKVYESMTNTQKKVTVLLETTRSLASILDLDKLIKVIMDSAKELLSSDRCTLFLHDPERKQLRAIIQGRDSVQEIRIPSNAGIAGAVFTSGIPINIHDAYKDSRFNPEVDKQTGYVTKTILCMPIKNILGECIGVTQMINKQRGVYSAEDEMILSSFSSQAAVAIEKSQLFKKTEDMRIYLQSILSSITSCVITLSESMKLNTINRPWFNNALGVDEAYMKEYPIEKWIGEDNKDLLKDIKQVYQSGEAIYVTDFEIKGRVSNVIVNYQVMPLIGSSGIVIVLDDISSEKRAVMTLGRYMSPALAKQVMEEGSGQLGGKRKKVSILFSDIRSFTTISEGMDPPEVVELLNHHFTDAVNAITEEQGILDKFIGDAVMAVFGVPFASDMDAVHACNTALKMRDALAITNRDRAEKGKITIKMGIGVNTGMVLSGNIGSVKRMEFSCIGDAVNLASRVEGLTKFYGITIMITEHTLKDTGDSFITREIESVIVTGKKTAVKMYELVGRKGELLDPQTQETIRLYSQGLEYYRQREFYEAAEMFQSAIDLTDDGPSKVLLTRTKNYIANPPSLDWKTDYLAEGK